MHEKKQKHSWFSKYATLLILVILIFNALVNKLTGASLDAGIGGK